MFKFQPWFEANRKRLIVVGVVALVGLLVWFFLKTQRQQQELAAGQAYTEFQLNQSPTVPSQQVVDGYLHIANEYSGTMAARRALLQAAITMFNAGRYADAQTQFQNFLAASSDRSLAATARLGVAASLEAQGKLDEALTTYRMVMTTYPDSTPATEAKFSTGRVLELQGKLTEAVTAYQDVTRSQLAGSLASVSAQRISQLQTKLAAIKPATKPVIQSVAPVTKPVTQPAAQPATNS